MPPFRSYRKESKTDYGTSAESLTLDQISTGCMQRIADAVEVIATDRVKLENDLAWYKNQYNQQQNIIEALRAKVNGMASARSRYKNQIQELQQQLNTPTL